MSHRSAVATLSAPATGSLGVFRGSAARKLGVTRNELTAMCRDGVLVREFPDTYRMAGVIVHRSDDRASLLHELGATLAA